jgi:carbonic anhydrase
MQFDAILERNRSFAAGRGRKPFPAPVPREVAFVACIDPRLDGVLQPALGLAEGEGVLIRAPGALVAPGSGLLRSIGVTAYLFAVEEVIVVGHASCRMAAFDTTAFIDTFRRRGVPREAFGSEDIRAWAGAVPDVRRGVLASVATIAAAPFLPKDLRVGGMLLDEETGALEVVARPGEVVRVEASLHEGAEVASPPAEHADADSPLPSTATGSTDSLHDAARSIVRSLAAVGAWREDLRRLRTDLARQRDPRARMTLLETFVGRAAAQSRDVAEVLGRLKREGAGVGKGSSRGGLLENLRRVLEEEGP